MNREHYNNFNLIRLSAALQALAVHAANHFGYKNWLVDALKIIPGVPTFFFISGFLIFSAYDRKQSQAQSGFFINRFLRIYPALFACVLLSILSVYLTGYFAGREIGAAKFISWIAGQITVVQFYNPPFMRAYGVGVLNGALWTVSVEMQFYLLVPLLYYALKKQLKLITVIFAVSLLLNLGLNLFLRNEANWDLMWTKLVYVSFAPWVYMFLVGFMAASVKEVRIFVSKINTLYLIVGYLLSMNFIGPYAGNASNAINPISFSILALIIMKVAAIDLILPAKIKEYIRRTDFSYGIYLYHMPIINLLLVMAWFTPTTNIALTIFCSFACAILSWYLIERPALSHKR